MPPPVRVRKREIGLCSESGEEAVVGLNRFEEGDAAKPAVFSIDTHETRRIEAALRDLRRTRDAEAVQAALADLEEACKGTDNLLPRILRAVEAYATVGEICASMEKVFGTYKEGM